MKMYRVRPRVDIEDLMKVIQTKGTFPWPSRDFVCRTSAEAYACWVALQTGRSPSIELRDPDQYATLRERVAYIMGVNE